MNSDLVDLKPVLTFVACAAALPCLVFIGYLAWRRFGPHHRHRRHRSRLRRYMGKS